jgi:hypothetical protein
MVYGVWVNGCVVYGCVGLWCMGVWVYVCVCGCMGVYGRVCVCMAVWVCMYGCISMSLCVMGVTVCVCMYGCMVYVWLYCSYRVARKKRAGILIPLWFGKNARPIVWLISSSVYVISGCGVLCIVYCVLCMVDFF